MYIRHEGEGTE